MLHAVRRGYSAPGPRKGLTGNNPGYDSRRQDSLPDRRQGHVRARIRWKTEAGGWPCNNKFGIFCRTRRLGRRGSCTISRRVGELIAVAFAQKTRFSPSFECWKKWMAHIAGWGAPYQGNCMHAIRKGRRLRNPRKAIDRNVGRNNDQPIGPLDGDPPSRQRESIATEGVERCSLVRGPTKASAGAAETPTEARFLCREGTGGRDLSQDDDAG